MWRITMLMKAAPGIGRQRAFQGLLDDYARLLVSQLSLARPELRRIVISCASETPGSGLPDMFDASAELYFDAEAAAGQTLAVLTQDKQLLAALARHCDAASMVAWMGEYIVNLDLPGANIRLTVTGDIADGLTVEEALKYWANVHPVVARTAREFFSYLRLYAQIHGRHAQGTNLYRAMAAEVGVESLADLITAYSHPQYMSIVRPDEMKFSKPGEMFAFATANRKTVLDR
jgi:hypothetical protein